MQVRIHHGPICQPLYFIHLRWGKYSQRPEIYGRLQSGLVYTALLLIPLCKNDVNYDFSKAVRGRCRLRIFIFSPESSAVRLVKISENFVECPHFSRSKEGYNERTV